MGRYLIVLLMLSGCSTAMPQLGSGSTFDLATTAVGLALGGKEVGLASACGSNPAVVFTCAYGIKNGR